MYTDYGQMQSYDEYLKEKAHEFQRAQADAAWVMMWLGRGVNVVGRWLVGLGQRLQRGPGNKPPSFSPEALSTYRTL